MSCFSDARGVIDKGKHIIDQTELTVSLRPPVKKLPPDPCRLHIKGLSEKTTADGLLSFMEVASGLDVLNVDFDTQNNAVVTFEGTPSNKLFSFCTFFTRLKMTPQILGWVRRSLWTGSFGQRGTRGRGLVEGGELRACTHPIVLRGFCVQYLDAKFPLVDSMITWTTLPCQKSIWRK